LASYFAGDTKADQFFAVYDNLLAADKANHTALEQLKREFHLKYSGHYRPQEVDLRQEVLDTENKGSVDHYLQQLFAIDEKVINNYYKDNPSIARQLISIKQQYETSEIGRAHV